MRPLPSSHTKPPLSDFLNVSRHAYRREELLATWSHRQLENVVGRGEVVRILPGIYCGVAWREDPQVRGQAVTLWNPDAVVTGRLALALLGWTGAVGAKADALVPWGSHPRPKGWLRFRQTAPVSETINAQGVRCTLPEKSLIEAWRRSTPRERVDVVYSALWEGLCTWSELARAVSNEARLPQRAVIERVLDSFSEGATSPLEVIAKRDVFVGPRFRGFEWQGTIAVFERRYVADMVHRAARVVVELDGGDHLERARRQRDLERDVLLAAAGYVTLRFTWADITQRPQWCASSVHDVVQARLLSEAP